MRGRGGSGFAWPLAAIVVLGAVVRVVFAVTQQQHVPLMGDAYVYTSGAKALASGRGWIDPYGGFVSIPTASHPPLYTAWLWVPAFFVDGHNITQFSSMLWSIVPGTGTVLLCGLAGREIAGHRTGLLAAGLAAVYPGFWIYDGQLLSETMAIFTAVGILLFAYRYWNRSTLARGVARGLVWSGDARVPGAGAQLRARAAAARGADEGTAVEGPSGLGGHRRDRRAAGDVTLAGLQR